MKKTFLITIVLVIALALNLVRITPAQAITLSLQWQGDGGYAAQGFFSYDQKTAPEEFSEHGPGSTQVLQSLSISFFDPDGNDIATYNNIVNGNSTANFLLFNFNTVKSEIFGLIDLGGEVAGETYLQGTVDTNLGLFQVPQSGFDKLVDSNSGTLFVKIQSSKFD